MVKYLVSNKGNDVPSGDDIPSEGYIFGRIIFTMGNKIPNW